MRKILIPTTLAACVLLSGCTGYGLGGLLGGNGYGDDYGYGYNNGGDFERAAVNACGREASRYGRVSIDRADQRDRDFVYVDGRISVRDRSRDEFQCVFRNDGRIVDFRLY